MYEVVIPINNVKPSVLISLKLVNDNNKKDIAVDNMEINTTILKFKLNVIHDLDLRENAYNYILRIKSMSNEKILADIDSSLSLQESTTTQGLEGKKIVVAEDSPFLIKIVNESFTKAGAVVEKFSDGKQALEYLREIKGENIHCVITDIEMPNMDGLTLTKNIKENSELKDIPVILFSSIVSEELRHKGISVGADAQITKPEIDRLVNMVIGIRD